MPKREKTRARVRMGAEYARMACAPGPAAAPAHDPTAATRKKASGPSTNT